MNFISYDLGTGGIKASLYNEKMETLAKSFIEYPTYYPQSYMHEQRPLDWWEGFKSSTAVLLKESGVFPDTIACLALSGHSLVTVPIGTDGNILLNQVPIWSDTRATQEAEDFFGRIDRDEWYLTTGNGFPAPCYSIFKLMWLKKHQPDIYSRVYKVLGSKDYINYMLTGEFAIDPSYASGTGAYSLIGKQMEQKFLDAAGISRNIFPEIAPSHHVLGTVSAKAAAESGLSPNTKVACGGVDNACMALGAVGSQDGRIYTSLGSSSWVPINSKTPVLDTKKKPYVFAHIEEDMFTSAFSIFAGGSSFKWAKDVLCKDISDNVYDKMGELAATVPVGSGGIIFNPSLAGGTSQDKSINIRGGYVGLSLSTTREAMIRAAMEGIAMNLKMSVTFLMQKTAKAGEILFCGGGSKSKFWMQMFADIFDMNIIKTNIDQDAASLGAAAIAARAVGTISDYAVIPSLHHIENLSKPNRENVAAYAKLQKIFEHVSDTLADLGDYMSKENNI